MKSIGASSVSVALAFSGYALSKMLLAPLFGIWSDRTGRRHLIVAGLSLYCLISFGYVFADSISLIAALRMMQGVAAALFRPIVTALIGDVIPTDRRGTSMGTFDISFYAAMGMGPVVGGVVRDVFGYQGVFAALSLLCCLSLGAAVTRLPHYCGRETRMAPAKIDLRSLGKNKLLLGLLGFILTRAFGAVSFAIFLPLFMGLVLRLNGLMIGVVMSSGTGLAVLLLRPMGRLHDGLRNQTLIAVGGATSAAFMLCLSMVSGFWSLLLTSLGVGVFSAMSRPASSALLIEQGRRHGIGLAVGLFNTFMNLGFVLGPLFGSFIMRSAGIRGVFFAAGFVGLAGSGFFTFCWVCDSRSARRGKPSSLTKMETARHYFFFAYSSMRDYSFTRIMISTGRLSYFLWTFSGVHRRNSCIHGPPKGHGGRDSSTHAETTYEPEEGEFPMLVIIAQSRVNTPKHKEQATRILLRPARSPSTLKQAAPRRGPNWQALNATLSAWGLRRRDSTILGTATLTTVASKPPSVYSQGRVCPPLSGTM